MMRTLALLAVVFALGTALVADDATKPGKSTVEAVSLSVYKKLDTKEFPFSGASTMLSIMVTNKDKRFLGVDPSSTVSELKDDKGNSLIKTDLFVKTAFNTMPRIGVDRTSVIVSVSSAIAPGRDATKIHLRGNLVLTAGLDEKTTDEKEVEMKMNAESKVGDFTVKVTQEKGFAGGGATFTVTSSKPNVKGVSAKLGGKAVEVSSGFSYGFGKSWTYTFTLKTAVEKPKIAVTWFSKEEKVTVPVDIEVGVGL
jgi:hypothetical protein